jgi:hypothetical protein
MTLSDSLISPDSRELARLPTDALRDVRARRQAEYEVVKALGMPFNLARGKPATEQVALANKLLTAVATPEECWAEDSTDCRNYYGNPQGLIEARRLFAPMLGAPPEQVLVANNSSLALMHDAVVYALLTGVRDGTPPWRDQRRPIRFLCPSPGYDRHFQICEQYGIEMITVALTGAGPDMDEVERLAADPAVKGMWCVPQYSNPTGETYSSETVARLARMRTAEDFRLFWDNAYAVHHLADTPDRLDNVLDACAAAGNPDRVLVFGSTSKITFAQAGLGPVDTHDRTRQAQSTAPCADAARRGRDRRAYGPASLPAPAQIRRCDGGVRVSTRRHGNRGLDPSARRLFCQP